MKIAVTFTLIFKAIETNVMCDIIKTNKVHRSEWENLNQSVHEIPLV